MATFLINREVTKEFIEENIGKFDPDNFDENNFNKIIVKLMEMGKIDTYMYSTYCGSTKKDSWYIRDRLGYYEECLKELGEPSMFPYRPSFANKLISTFINNTFCISPDDLRRSVAYLNLQVIKLLKITKINLHSYFTQPNRRIIYPIDLFCYGTKSRTDWKITINGDIAILKKLEFWQKECIEQMYEFTGRVFLGEKYDIRLPEEPFKNSSVIFHDICYLNYDEYYNSTDLQKEREKSRNTNRLVRETLSAGGVLPLDSYNIPTFLHDRVAFIPYGNKADIKLGIVRGCTKTLLTVEEISTGDVYKCSRGEFVKV